MKERVINFNYLRTLKVNTEVVTHLHLYFRTYEDNITKKKAYFLEYLGYIINNFSIILRHNNHCNDQWSLKEDLKRHSGQLYIQKVLSAKSPILIVYMIDHCILSLAFFLGLVFMIIAMVVIPQNDRKLLIIF